MAWPTLPFIPMTSHSYSTGHHSHPSVTKDVQKLLKTNIFDFYFQYLTLSLRVVEVEKVKVSKFVQILYTGTLDHIFDDSGEEKQGDHLIPRREGIAT